ncbi:MAG: hypothetical protein Ct9H300mP1_03470 [Planctomycetaceae bacterium]|nr:MAG: hypothetical protein Ct9H300mP1_03470 [Planctomycetaceae bacterium]
MGPGVPRETNRQPQNLSHRPPRLSSSEPVPPGMATAITLADGAWPSPWLTRIPPGGQIYRYPAVTPSSPARSWAA